MEGRRDRGKGQKSWINSGSGSTVHHDEFLDMKMQGQTTYTTNKFSKRDNTDQLWVLKRDRNEGAWTWSLNLIYIRMLRSFKLCQSRRREELCKKKQENLKEASSPMKGIFNFIILPHRHQCSSSPTPGLISQLWQHLDYTSTDCKYVLAANPVYPIVHKTLLWNRIWLPKILPSPSPTSPPPAPTVWLEP